MLLAIDPGIDSVAWALLDSRTGKLKDCGVIFRDNPKLTKQPAYLDMVYSTISFLSDLDENLGPIDTVVIEWLSFGSPKFIKVGSACGMSAVVGAIASMFQDRYASVKTVLPQSWKRAKSKSDAWVRYAQFFTTGEDKLIKNRIDSIYLDRNITQAKKSETDIMDAVCIAKYGHEQNL